MRKDLRNQFFPPFLISILVIIIPSLVSLILLLQISIRNSIEIAKMDNERMLSQIRDQLESVLSELEMAALSLTMNPEVNSVFRILNNEEYLDYYSIYEIQNKLPRYELSNRYISGIDIVIKNKDFVLSPSGSIEDFYGFIGRKFFPDLDESSAYGFLWDKSYLNDLICTKGGLWFMCSFPLQAKKPSALVIIELNKAEFYRMFSYYDLGPGGKIELLKNGRKLFSFPETPAESVKDERMIKNRLLFRSGELGIDLEIPYSHALQPYRIIMGSQIIITFFSIAVTVILGFFIIKWNSKPLLDLLNRLSSENERQIKNSYASIYESVDFMLQEKQSIKEHLKLQEGFLQKSYIGNLIRGEFGDSAESAEIAEIAGLSEEFLPAAVFILKNMKTSERGMISFYNQNMMGTEVARFVGERLKSRLITYPLDEGAILFLLSVKSGTCVEDILRGGLLRHLNNAGLKSVGLFYGGLERDAEGIYKAFSVAEFNLKTHSGQEAGFFPNTSGKAEIKTFTYPVEWELKLLTFVKAGNTERASSLLDEIENVNFIDNKISLLSQQQLVTQMVGTISRYTQSLFSPESGLSDPAAAFAEIKGKILEFSFKNALLRNEEEQGLKRRMTDFIWANYSDPGFSLCRMAERFDMTDTVFYNSFRTIFNETFARYLESVRIKKSIELLSTGMKIVDVAEETGFGNTQTFRRVFRKRTGIAPSSFIKTSS